MTREKYSKLRHVWLLAFIMRNPQHFLLRNWCSRFINKHSRHYGQVIYILQVICCHIMMMKFASTLVLRLKINYFTGHTYIYTYGTLLLQQGGNCCPSCSKMYQLQTIPLKLPSFACNLIKQLIKVFGPLLANCCGSIISRAKPLCFEPLL